MPNSATSFDWETLLIYISDRRVIPVVGRELLSLEIDGEEILLETYLARSLAESLGVNGGSHLSLNQVALAYLREGGQRRRIYPRLKAILEERTLPVPTPLRQLAAITDFSLFVSTTPDLLLFQAIDEQAQASREPVPVGMAYSMHAEIEDLPVVRLSRERHVYQLFGRASASTDYAVTDEDTLEILNSLQSEEKRPSILFDELKDSHLLLLGCGFPDWLARFFLRTVANKRLLPPRETSELFADRPSREDRELILFLQYLETELFPSGDPLQFVDELHRRWLKRNVGKVSADIRRVPHIEREPGFIFLSYAREDRAAVEAMAKELEARGLNVWFDQKELLPGDAWERRIRDNVERCALFFPILSRNAEQRIEGYFRKEWAIAVERLPKFDENFPFIQPILIDDLQERAPGIPPHFWTRQTQRFPGGRPTEEFVERAREKVRTLHAQLKSK